MIVKVKIEEIGGRLPTRANSYAAGWDLYASLLSSENFRIIPPGGRLKISAGVSMEIPHGYEGQVRPRSGLSFKEGAVCAFGTIDSDYRGVVSVCLFNHSFNHIRVEHGQRIGQIVFSPVVNVSIKEVTELSETERGSNGFGSTGR